MQRNPYWPRNGPSFFSVLEIPSLCFSRRPQEVSAWAQISWREWQTDARTFPRNGSTFNDTEKHGRQRSHCKYVGDNVIAYRDVMSRCFSMGSYS
jgi:hypothetical protein